MTRPCKGTSTWGSTPVTVTPTLHLPIKVSASSTLYVVIVGHCMLFSGLESDPNDPTYPFSILRVLHSASHATQMHGYTNCTWITFLLHPSRSLRFGLDANWGTPNISPKTAYIELYQSVSQHISALLWSVMSRWCRACFWKIMPIAGVLARLLTLTRFGNCFIDVGGWTHCCTCLQSWSEDQPWRTIL